MSACGGACGAQRSSDEKDEQPKRLFNYKPFGERSPEYKEMPDCEREDIAMDEYVEGNRKMIAAAMSGLNKIPMYADAISKTEITKLTVEKNDICDADVTVYALRPKSLPKEGCAAMIFAHGLSGIMGTASQFNPMYAFAALNYGVVGFNVDYRLAPENGNKGGSDMYSTLKYVYNNAGKLGIDKTQIGMEGNAAGAHHMFNACYLMAQKKEAPMCKMMISEIGMFTSRLMFTKKEDLELKEEKLGVGKMDLPLQAFAGDDYKDYVAEKNPMLFPDLAEKKYLEHYPPVAFFSPEFCFFHSATKQFADRLDKLGKLLEFRLIRGLGHLYTMSQNKEVEEVFKDRVTCVNTYLKK